MTLFDETTAHNSDSTTAVSEAEPVTAETTPSEPHTPAQAATEAEVHSASADE